MNNLIVRILNRYNRPVSSHGFALFRILFCLLTLRIILHIVYFAPVFFDSIEGISRNNFPARLFLYMWFMVVVFLGLGLFTRVMSVVNYLFTVITTAFLTNAMIGSFNDDLLRIGGFLMIFMPVSRSFSVDALIERITSVNPVPRTTSYHNYLFALFISLGFLYFGSGYTKLFSPMWQQGLGVWLPSLMPYNHWNHFHMLFADNYFACVITSVLVVVFELVFIFLLFYRKAYLWLAIAGIAMHIIIAIEFPFPLIALGPLPFYFLMLGNRFWARVRQKVRVDDLVLITYDPKNIRQHVLVRFVQAFDLKRKFLFEPAPGPLSISGKATDSWKAACILLNRIPVLMPLAFIMQARLFRVLAEAFVSDVVHPAAFDRAQSKPWISYQARQFYFGCFIMLLILLQTVSLAYHSYSRLVYNEKTRAEKRVKGRAVHDFSTKPTNLGRVFFGINSRGLFLEHSYSGKQNSYAIAYIGRNGEEHWLPYFDKEGLCTGWNFNMYWAKYTFNSVCFSSLPANPRELEKATQFWATKHKVLLDSIPMIVYRRQYVFPKTFEAGIAQKMLDQPWEVEGRILWRNKIFRYARERRDTTAKH